MPTPTQMTPELPSILLYGRPGSGKTTLAMTLGDQIEILMTDRGGWGPALSFKDAHSEKRKQCEITPCYEEPNQPGSGFRKVKDRLFQIQDLIRSGKYPRKAVALDSLTTLGDQAMRMVLANSGRMDRGAIRTELTNTGIGIQHWGLGMTEVENCLAILRSFPILRLAIAHDDTEVIDGNTQKIISVIGSKLAPKVPSYFNEVWYSWATVGAGGITKHVIQSALSSAILARSQNGLPNQTEMSLGLTEILKLMGHTL